MHCYGTATPPPLANIGARKAVEHYKRLSQASKKGRIYDDCLREGKLWADKNKTADAPKKARGKGRSGSLL
ncbi:hypothetical protein SOASR014_40560 [Pectobacterium carotovorum subsp. carotovorum]|nr:hypothetical protein SOASR014_40560 [Pectobacterium carotovorum subsp. carotovorum]GLX46410.1 hypothetical protein Pcaca01_40780 [Pectobacterium carotovorum subsp. carotovorum]